MRLLESDTGAIERWCDQVESAGPKAKYMLDPLIELDYKRMERKAIQRVEEALWFGVFGKKRSDSAKTQ